MAGLWGLKILLLCAGIIGLANCQDGDQPAGQPNIAQGANTTATPAPPASTLPSPSPSPSTTPSTTPKLDSQANTTQSQTSPPITISITTVTATKATTPAPPQCSYTVKAIRFGFQIDMMTSTTGNYTINIKEKDGPKTEEKFTVHSFIQNSKHEIKDLKPCTEYEHNVTFIDSAGNVTSCNNTENKTQTITISEGDISEGSCKPGYVCYRSDWDISSSLFSSNNIPAEKCTNGSTFFCIKPRYDDICTDLTTTFTSETCLGSFNLTRSITVDSLDPEINQKFLNELPVKIESITPKLPPNCSNLTIDYTCWENGNLNHTKKLSELEPFTEYSCNGQIKENNVTIKNKKTAVNFKGDCDLTINYIKESATNTTSTSIYLKWSTTSNNCQDVLPNLQKNLSYDCSCTPSNKKQRSTTKKLPSGGTCNITGLEPFQVYTCVVQPKYNDKKVPEQKKRVTEETKSGKPDDIDKLLVAVPENNVIRVTCGHSNRFNGPQKIFSAILLYAGVIQKNLTKEKECDFEFKDLSYSTEYKLEVTAFNGHFRSNPKKESVTTHYNDKAVIGFLVFLIIIVSVALLLVVYKIYILKRTKSHDLGENMMLISTANDEENLLPVEPIAAELLLEAYKRKLADEGRLFLHEFQSIPRIFSRYSVKEAKKPCNVPKNRYVDILPYDYNRVQLTTGNGETGSDYINASFIDGYKESKKYIAAQGPKDETVSDFWRMVWEQQSSIIVMVTRCEEGNRVKCAQYWPSPDRETEIFAEFIVKLNSEDHCPDYTIRHLSLTNKREKNSEREVTHIQFMSWPDHGVPGEPHLLLKLRRRVNAFKNFFSGPIVIHCSAGVGRTGTYIGIDAMMEGLEAEGRVDIYGYVVRLRRQRCLMVQVEAQYILIHQALLEHNQFGETEFTVSELHSTLSTLKQKNPGNEPTLMEEEFERLPSYKNWRTFNTGITEENKKKNRFSSVIPYDYNRVLLKVDEGRSHDSEPDEEDEDESSDEEDEESTQYINASHIDGYWGPRTFIAAQTPLPDTMADFWLMVYQKKASTIIMLSDCKEGDQESDCVYWDKDKKTFGDFEVEVASTDTSPTFISRNMLIRHVKRKDSRPVKHFQFLKWASSELPQSPQDLTDMIKDIKHSCGSKSQKTMPVVVHCNDGSSRSGIFCALWNLLDSADTEKLVDVFQVVKTLRKERQGMLSSLEQYQFLYDALEGVFPIQNGEVKAVQASAADSVQVVNETKAAEQPTEETAKQPASTTTNDQQEPAESSPLVTDGGNEDKKEEPEKVSTETTPLEDTSNSATVTVEV
ncbi:receptor-type tyrosine-protein phosphatase C isoform X2 [Sander lucioperca]|uniref:receptor-type tyrosine-protein phosphatase C isoform X2 n=1 Tax=Sander lucioperca TaxID=283035 RepID=UPI0016534742|nr:receptor-type tyrosine-protein phosphatase C isoform X2 [Sander lucioperca]